MPGYSKDPDAVLDYQFDWSAWLDDTDSIASHDVTATDGITIDSTSATTTAVTVWLSGGTAGETYRVTCHIVTADARTDERTMRVIIRER